MIRILHVIDSLHLGGAQEVIMNLATCGNRNKFVHEVATMHGRGVYWDRLAALGVPLYSLSPHKFLPWYLPKLSWLLTHRRFDILQCHLIASNIFAKPIGALCGVRIIINHDHTNDSYRACNGARLLLDSLSNRLANRIIAVSGSCRNFLVSREGIPMEKISVIQNAIDLRRFLPSRDERALVRKKMDIPLESPLIAGVGRLNPQKNFSLFIEVAAIVARYFPNARFLLAGNGPEEQMLRRKVIDSGLANQVIFAGYVADTRQVYLASDVLLMPSRFEGLPMTLLEAMAMKVPVVASALDGIAEVIADGEDGFLVEPNAREIFARKIISLLENPELALRIGENARQKICSHFSAERMCTQVEAVYESILSS